MVETRGLEPLTSAVQRRRSPKLSYVPKDWGGRSWDRTTDLGLIRTAL